MNDLDKATQLELHLPTIQEDACMSIVGLLPQDGISIEDLGYVLVVLNLSIPKSSLRDDVIMGTPISSRHHHENSKNHGKTQVFLF